MNTKEITITRRSALGFGYNASAANGEHGWYIPAPTKPDHTGTYRQVCEAIDADRTLASFQNGTYYTSAWFARYNGEWCKIVTDTMQWDLSQHIFDNGFEKIDAGNKSAVVTIEVRETNQAAVSLGKLGGAVKSDRKSASSAANGKLGGRPRKS